MIVTCKKTVPLRWITFAVMPWAAFVMTDRAITVAFIFSLKKFIENPAGLSFIMSLSSFIGMIVGPTTSFISDRIWTRFGRRKPFLITAWTGMSLALLAMPFAPNLIALLAAYFLFYFSQALNAPMEPLKQEIIPPSERGRATGIMAWISNFATITFYFVMLGRFDDITFMGGIPIRGEAVIYWSAGLFLLTMLTIVVLGIKEVDQHSPLRGQKLSLRTFAGGLLDRELWPVYLLVFAFAFVNFYSGIGALSNLLYTEQWGYSKQEMGVNVAIGGLINVFLIGLLTFFADRLPRMRAYQTFICLTLAGNFLFYVYVNFVLPDHRPTLVEIIAFGELLSVISILMGVVYYPLIYDYVQRNKMGTFAAGEQIVRRITVFFTANTVGLFVWFYAALFQPPAGPMTRVVLNDDLSPAAITAKIQAAMEQSPGTDASAGSRNVSVRPWSADGSASPAGRAWEIRFRDKQQEALANERTDLERERAKLSTDASTVAAHQSRLRQIADRSAQIDQDLARSAAAFNDIVTHALGDRFLSDGDQILSAERRDAVLIEIATPERWQSDELENLARKLRSIHPGLIDLLPERRGETQLIVASLAFPPDRVADEDMTTVAQTIFTSIVSGGSDIRGAPRNRELNLLGWHRTSALAVTLQVVETPVSSYVSPVTRCVNSIWRLFGSPPSPTRRLDAIARSLRSSPPQHVSVSAGLDESRLSVVAVIGAATPSASGHPEILSHRLHTLLPAGNNQEIAFARDLIARTETAAAAQRITVARPVITSRYAPMHYDYMSGYLWMFIMSIIGISLTVAFRRLERNGVVRKRGVEEAQAT